MLRFAFFPVLVTSLTIIAGCASSSPTGPAAPGAPAQAELPYADIPMGTEPFSKFKAERLVREYEAAWLPPEGDALRNPESLEEILNVLKLDQTNLFENATEAAKEIDSLEARVLRAQIELAWGEAYIVAIDVLLTLSRHLDTVTMQLQMAQRPTAADEARLERLRELSDRMARVQELLQSQSFEHMSKGSQLAENIIANEPESYVGYRLAADHARVVRKWKLFAKMVEKIEAKNPDSNGLIFLRGAASLHRDDDRETAMELYRRALANDPRFVRARAHMVMAQTDVDGIAEQLDKLAAANPNHQLVGWIRPALQIVLSEAN